MNATATRAKKRPAESTDYWPPLASGMTLQWYDGWIECFPETEFTEECEGLPGRTLLHRRWQMPLPSDYRLSVAKRTAVLDYGGEYRELNEMRGWDVGRLRITFSDEGRTIVEKLEWAKDGSSKYRSIEVKCSWAAAQERTVQPFSIPGGEDQRLRAIGEKVLRPGQLRFREMLRQAYDDQCAITGFAIWDALEAAHIVPYMGSKCDHVQNGLLLRADLHRLFDRLLLSINPSTRSVVLAPELQHDHWYAPLQDQPLREPKKVMLRASADALTHHWERFLRRRA